MKKINTAVTAFHRRLRPQWRALLTLAWLLAFTVAGFHLILL